VEAWQIPNNDDSNKKDTKPRAMQLMILTCY